MFRVFRWSGLFPTHNLDLWNRTLGKNSFFWRLVQYLRSENVGKSQKKCKKQCVKENSHFRTFFGVHSRPYLSSMFPAMFLASYIFHFCSFFVCLCFEQEHKCQHPKQIKLCLIKAKSGETLVKACGGIDAQIIRNTDLTGGPLPLFPCGYLSSTASPSKAKV